MRVVLQQDMEGLGKAGDIVEVKDGFCRNYLFPRGLCVPARSRSAKAVEHARRMVELRLAKERKKALELKARLEEVSPKIAVEAGEEDRLFGSVTNRDIAVALAEAGFDVDHKQIRLETPIRHLGIYTVDVRVGPDLTAKVKVWVVAK